MANDPFINADPVKAIIRVRRGPEADREQYIYEDGEFVWSTDKKRAFIGDGAEQGGILISNKTWVVDNFQKLANLEINDCVFRSDTSAFYILTGYNYLMEDNYILVGGGKLLNNVFTGTTYTLPDATSSDKGGVIVGDGLQVDSGVISIDYDDATLDIVDGKLTVIGGTNNGTTTFGNATYTQKGIVQVLKTNTKGGIAVDTGNIYVNLDNSTIKLSSENNANYLYVEPSNIPFNKIATTTKLGGIIVGNGLSVEDTGKTKLNIATGNSLGGIIVGDGLDVDDTGVLSINNGNKVTSLAPTTSSHVIRIADVKIQTGIMTFPLNSIQTKAFYYPESFNERVISVAAIPNRTAAMVVSDISLLSCNFTNSWAGSDWQPNALTAYVTVIGI